jgi:hypothetical protein
LFTYTCNGSTKLNIKGVQVEIFGSTFPLKRNKEALRYAFLEANSLGTGIVEYAGKVWAIKRDDIEPPKARPYIPPKERVHGTPLLSHVTTERFGAYMEQRV